MLFFGIDPGLTGAIACLGAEERWLKDASAYVTVGIYRPVAMARLLAPYAGQPVTVCIEEQHSFPKDGAKSAFTNGFGYGLWVMAAAAYDLSTIPVRAQVWKKDLGVTSDKWSSIMKAQQLFPRFEVSKYAHHGRAEALLIAYYAMINYPAV